MQNKVVGVESRLYIAVVLLLGTGVSTNQHQVDPL